MRLIIILILIWQTDQCYSQFFPDSLWSLQTDETETTRFVRVPNTVFHFLGYDSDVECAENIYFVYTDGTPMIDSSRLEFFCTRKLVQEYDSSNNLLIYRIDSLIVLKGRIDSKGFKRTVELSDFYFSSNDSSIRKGYRHLYELKNNTINGTYLILDQSDENNEEIESLAFYTEGKIAGLVYSSKCYLILNNLADGWHPRCFGQKISSVIKTKNKKIVKEVIYYGTGDVKRAYGFKANKKLKCLRKLKTKRFRKPYCDCKSGSIIW
jgi:hypothetical protein